MCSRFASIVLLSSLLSACTPTSDRALTADDSFTVQEEAAPEGELAFTILDDGRVVTDYTVTHTKEMHLIAVRSDLEHFQHLHPVRDAEGVWRIPLSVPAGGTYWFYADFGDTEGQPRTVRFVKEMTGEGNNGDVQPHPGELVKDPDGYDAAQKVVNEYRIQVATLRSTDGVTFHYTVLDSQGQQVMFEDYLGAKGHSVLISPEGDFVHTHPFTEYEEYRETDRPIFFVQYPRNDFYRIFTQFQVRGKVLTGDFDWHVPQPPSEGTPGTPWKGHGGGHGTEVPR